LLYDMRAFWPDERVDGKLWPAGGRLFRIAKSLQRKLLLSADHVVVLTAAGEREVRTFDYLAGKTPPITRIPTCADLDRFTIQGPPQRDPFVLGYVGSLGTWYMLEEMLRCFVALQRRVPDARLLFVNRGEHAMIRERANAAGIPDASLEIVSATHSEVPALVARMSAAMAVIMPSYSKTASSPTKLAEYLGCGVPCLGNVDVGDVGDILESNRVGVALPGFSETEIEAGVERLLALTMEPDIQQRCRAAAVELFSLNGGVEAYDRIYTKMSGL